MQANGNLYLCNARVVEKMLVLFHRRNILVVWRVLKKNCPPSELEPSWNRTDKLWLNSCQKTDAYCWARNSWANNPSISWSDRPSISSISSSKTGDLLPSPPSEFASVETATPGTSWSSFSASSSSCFNASMQVGTDVGSKFYYKYLGQINPVFKTRFWTDCKTNFIEAPQIVLMFE